MHALFLRVSYMRANFERDSTKTRLFSLSPQSRCCREESDCAARDSPDRTEIRSGIVAVAVAASAVAVAASSVAVAAPAVTAVSTSCATGTLFSALPAHYGERAKHSFRSGDGREARPHNWW